MSLGDHPLDRQGADDAEQQTKDQGPPRYNHLPMVTKPDASVHLGY
jgi:hypothetical protein